MGLLLLFRSTGLAQELQAQILSSATIQANLSALTYLQGAVQSSVTLQAHSSFVQGLSVPVFSSFTMDANSSFTQQLGVGVNSSFTVGGKVASDFTPGVGFQSGLFRSETILENSTQDFSHISWAYENSSSPGIEKSLDITTSKTRVGVAEFGNTFSLIVRPPSTNPHPIRLAGTPLDDGIAISSRGTNSLTLRDRSGTDVFLYTTAEGTTIEGVKLLLS